jgi:hypothetical protein
MNLKTFLRNATADARFMRGKPSARLRLKNFSKGDKIDDQFLYMDSLMIYGLLKGHVKENVETWLSEYASGKYRVEECWDSVIVTFSREDDAVMYRLGGPYV